MSRAVRDLTMLTLAALLREAANMLQRGSRELLPGVRARYKERALAIVSQAEDALKR